MNLNSPSPRHPLAQFLVDYNPFYLLSAMCMLAGLFALNDSLDWSPLPARNLLWLILTLNIYEAMLIGMGIFLAGRGLIRDAATLFMLEAFFLVDAGFLNSEVYSLDLRLGIAVNAVLLILAAVKIAGVFMALGIPLADARYRLVLVQMLMLLSIPGFLKYAADNEHASLPALAIYLVWWVVGLVPILHLALGRPVEARHRRIVGAFMILPIVSIVAHLCTSNWVYNVRWYSANVSPLLLGLAVAVGTFDTHVRTLATRMRAQLALPLVALLLTLSQPSLLCFTIDEASITPLRLTLVAATIVYLHGLLVHRHPYFGLAGAACIGAAGLGENPSAMLARLGSMGGRVATGVDRVAPRGTTQWGLVSVAASFVLLVLGLGISLLKSPRGVAREK